MRKSMAAQAIQRLTCAQAEALYTILVANMGGHPCSRGRRTTRGQPWAITVNSIAASALEDLGLVKSAYRHLYGDRYRLEFAPTARAARAWSNADARARWGLPQFPMTPGEWTAESAVAK